MLSRGSSQASLSESMVGWSFLDVRSAFDLAFDECHVRLFETAENILQLLICVDSEVISWILREVHRRVRSHGIMASPPKSAFSL